MADLEIRKQLRLKLRQKRRSLSAEQQTLAAEKLLKNIQHSDITKHHQHIALYLSNDGEINPEPVIDWLWQQGKLCYLPVLNDSGNHQLDFVAYQSVTTMVKNRFGINEPENKPAQRITPHQLDLVFMPLTGFDEQGQRMGMGGGYYDRTFAFVEKDKTPVLIGLAHECQKVVSVYTSDWDVPMQGVVTDQHCYFY